MTFEEANAIVPAPAPAVEPETTEPSTSESETTTEPVEAPADASVSTESVEQTPAPTEATEETPRAQKRIQELTRKNKDLEDQVNYWQQLQQTPPPPPEESADITSESIADAVLHKQQLAQLERAKVEAQTAMQRDAAAALVAHPELETDNELADIVVAFAQKNNISFSAAADRVKARMNQEQKKAEAKVLASQAIRSGASSPSGAKVETGQLTPPDISKMSEEDKAANWDKIIASMA